MDQKDEEKDMTKKEFQELAASDIVLLDGATGSNFRKAGMPVGVSTELWAMKHPDVVRTLQSGYVEAGSQIIYAPTFSANRLGLEMHGLTDRIEEINTKLVKLSKEIAGDRAYVAGDMTTTGRMLEPAGDISYEELLDVYKEQAVVLANAGADLIIAETMLSVDETTVLLDAVQAVCDLPVMCSLTLEADGRALYGGDAVEAVETLQAMGAVSVGLNCSVGPNQLEAVICSMKEVAEIPVLAKPNAGMPVMDKMGFAHYDMTPEQFAAAMEKLIEAGAGVVGGCCGTTPEYIRALAKVIGR